MAGRDPDYYRQAPGDARARPHREPDCAARRARLRYGHRLSHPDGSRRMSLSLFRQSPRARGVGRFPGRRRAGGYGNAAPHQRGRARRARTARLSRQRRARDGRGYPGPHRGAARKAHCGGGPGCPGGGTEHTANTSGAAAMRQRRGHATRRRARAGVAERGDRVDSRQPERAFCWPAAALAGRTPGLSSHTVVTPTRARGNTATEGWGMIAIPVPPGPRTRVPGAHLLAFARDMLGFVCRLKREYGDVVAFRLGPERAVLLGPPAHLDEGAVRTHR